MSKVPRRKKTIAIDGTNFTISPLTYKENEERIERALAFAALKVDVKDLNKEQREQLLKDTLFVVCCGLNGADPSLNLTIEEARGEVDDQLAAQLFQEIIEFTGYKIVVPEPGEQADQGEPKASS
jgi:hypothetical protein